MSSDNHDIILVTVEIHEDPLQWNPKENDNNTLVQGDVILILQTIPRKRIYHGHL